MTVARKVKWDLFHDWTTPQCSSTCHLGWDQRGKYKDQAEHENGWLEAREAACVCKRRQPRTAGRCRWPRPAACRSCGRSAAGPSR